MERIKHFLFLIFFISILSPCIAQDSLRRKADVVLKTDIFMPFMDYVEGGWTSYSITAEKLFCKRHSAQLTYLNSSIERPNDYPSSIHNFQIITDYKYFLFHRKKYSGLYAGIYLKFSNIDERLNTPGYYRNYVSEDIERILAPGGLVGVQYYLWKGITIEVKFGMGCITMDAMKVKSGSFSTNGRTGQLDAQAAINIGYRF